MKKLIVILTLLFAVPASAAEYVCGTAGVDNSCTPGNLTSLLGLATDGDTLRITAGNHMWSSAVTVTKKVTITGGGSLPDGGSADPTATWSWPTTLSIGTNGAFVVNTPTSGSLVRISGLYISGTGPNHSYTDGANAGIVVEHTNNQAQYRFDNLRFDTAGGGACVFRTNGINAYGVIDHIYANVPGTGGSNSRFLYITGHGGDQGNTDWSRATVWGSANFVYVEDSTVTSIANSSTPYIGLDSQGGGRVALRHNYLENGQWGNHGTESGWPARSGVAIEAYNNVFNWTSAGDKLHTALFWRGGSVYIHDNTFTNYQSMLKPSLYRAGGNPGNSPPAGTSPYDGPGPPTGYPLIDQQGRGQAAGVGLGNTQPQAANKAYIWNNTLIATGGGGGCGNQGDFNEISNCDPSYIVAGRDYEYSSDNTARPPNYTPYPYPHPLISGVVTPPPVDTSATWTFGDGGTATGLSATNVYVDNGVYTAILTITNNAGNVGTDSMIVTVINVAPTADAGPDMTVNLGQVVQFTGDYTDPGITDTPTFAWEFGDQTRATVQHPTHIYSVVGSYNVTLTVTDNDGAVGTDTMIVTVVTPAPVVDAGPDQTVNEGDIVYFVGL